MSDATRIKDAPIESQSHQTGNQTEPTWTESSGNNDYWAAVESRNKTTQSSLPDVELTFDSVDSNNSGYLADFELDAAISSPGSSQADKNVAQFLKDNIEDVQEASNDEWFDESRGITRKDISAYLKENVDSIPQEMRDQLYEMLYPGLMEQGQHDQEQESSGEADGEVPAEEDQSGQGGASEDGGEPAPAEEEEQTADDAQEVPQSGDAPAEQTFGEYHEFADQAQIAVSIDADGKLQALRIKEPGEDGAPDQEITISRGDNGWTVNPPGAEISAFENLSVNADGTVPGNFRTNENGDIILESDDGRFENLRFDGGRVRTWPESKCC